MSSSVSSRDGPSLRRRATAATALFRSERDILRFDRPQWRWSPGIFRDFARDRVIERTLRCLVHVDHLALIQKLVDAIELLVNAIVEHERLLVAYRTAASGRRYLPVNREPRHRHGDAGRLAFD